jgi:hypothetical protein
MTTAACGGGEMKAAAPATSSPPATQPAPTTTVFPAVRTKGSLCRMAGALPDPACTPGALNPDVTQANVASTICTPGWTTTARASDTSTGRLKSEAATAYGITDPLGTFQGDHLISLELGGAPADIANFWDQPNSLVLPDGSTVAAGQKDALETNLKNKVCGGQVLLLDAQRQIASDWLGAWAAAGRPGAAPSTTTPIAALVSPTTPPTTSVAIAPTTPATSPATTSAPVVTSGPSSAYYPNCAAVRAAGKAPLHRGDPGYSSSLDRDGDGIACE